MKKISQFKTAQESPALIYIIMNVLTYCNTFPVKFLEYFHEGVSNLVIPWSDSDHGIILLFVLKPGI